MPIKIGTYISSLIDSGRRRIKVLVTGRSDVQNAYESLPFGIDNSPPENIRAIYAETGEKGRNIILGYINQNQLNSLQEGETSFYSTSENGETIQSFMTMRNDGTIEILGTGDFLVRFNELQTGFNQLRSDFNTLINLYNAHVHITTATVGATAVPGVISATVSTGTPSTASIDASKIDEIKTA